MELWFAILIIVLVYGLTIFLGIRLNRGKPCSDRWLPHGLYRIEALIHMDSDYIWFALWHYQEREIRYVKIRRSHILDSHLWPSPKPIKDSVKDVLVCKEGGLRYIRFQEQ